MRAAVPPDRPGPPDLRPVWADVPAAEPRRRLVRHDPPAARLGVPGVLPRNGHGARRLAAAASRLLCGGGGTV